MEIEREKNTRVSCVKIFHKSPDTRGGAQGHEIHVIRCSSINDRANNRTTRRGGSKPTKSTRIPTILLLSLPDSTTFVIRRANWQRNRSKLRFRDWWEDWEKKKMQTISVYQSGHWMKATNIALNVINHTVRAVPEHTFHKAAPFKATGWKSVSVWCARFWVMLHRQGGENEKDPKIQVRRLPPTALVDSASISYRHSQQSIFQKDLFPAKIKKKRRQNRSVVKNTLESLN